MIRQSAYRRASALDRIVGRGMTTILYLVITTFCVDLYLILITFL